MFLPPLPGAMSRSPPLCSIRVLQRLGGSSALPVLRLYTVCFDVFSTLFAAAMAEAA